jgi:anti-sigma factor RsiW
MNDDALTSGLPRECAAARETVQELLDGTVEAERREALESHLAACGECREVRRGLVAVRAGLRSLPETPFPDDALRQVWDRTVNAGRGATFVAPWRPRFVTAAALAASLVLFALIFSWSRRLPPDPGPARLDAEQIEQVRREARQVLELTAAALKRGERAAIERVVEGEVSPAIRRIGIQWPQTKVAVDRRSKT